MSDSANMQTVAAVCRVCLQPAPPTWGSGPHTLSEMIMGRYFGMYTLILQDVLYSFAEISFKANTLYVQFYFNKNICDVFR